jgi:AraC family transcriptional regulator
MLSAPTSSLDLTEERIWQQFALASPILSSQSAGWKRVQLVYHRQPPHEIPSHCFAQHVIAICAQPHPARLKLNGRWRREQYSPGDIGVMPAHHLSPTTQSETSGEYLALFLDPESLTHAAFEAVDADQVELIPHFKTPDPLIQQMGWALKQELELSAGESSLYAEAMAVALSVHLLQRYCTKQVLLRDYAEGLPKFKLRQVIAYIHEHLDQDLSLGEMAAIATMSPHYFATQFKQSTGVSPHQYVMRCRIDRAKALLPNRELSIMDVLLQVGFKSQSHFTRVFRQQVSATPKVYRDGLWN